MCIKSPNRQSGFTLVEIMIVVAIIALLAALAVPSFLRARKRSQATASLESLRLIDGAFDQYQIETGHTGALFSDLAAYVKTGSALYGQLTSNTIPLDALGTPFAFDPSVQTTDNASQGGAMLISVATENALSDVIPNQQAFRGHVLQSGTLVSAETCADHQTDKNPC